VQIAPDVAEPVRATAILNLGSGSQRQLEVADKLSAVFARPGADLRIGYARRIKDVFSFARDAVAEGRPIVLAGGGDGTISAIASVLSGSQTAMAVLPIGTFNLFARSLGVPEDIESAAALCFDGVVRSVPLAEVNGRVFLNNASLGLYPAMLRVREETYQRWGRRRFLAYVTAGFAMLRRRRHMLIRMATPEGEQLLRTPLLFAARNPLQIESVGIAGSGCVERGNIAFYILPPVGRWGLLRAALRLMLRRASLGTDLHLVCADSAYISAHRQNVRVAYDGEIERMSSPLEFRVRPDALRVLVPAPSPQAA
jgi:diacylglycerol kinase family enzyme